MQEFINYINYWIEPGELLLAGIGLIFLIIIFYLGGKAEKGEPNNGDNK